MSSAELFLTLLVALVAFGPNKLPMLAEHLGKLLNWFTRLKQQADSIWQTQLAEQQLKENTLKAQQADSLYQKSLDEV